MGFSTALSGLKGASTSLSVTGNNIANSQTAGFKESRAQFGDVYVSSMGSSGKTAVGTGSRVSNVAQQFRQGTIEATGNSLDLAISGEGFFAMADSVDPLNPTKPLEATSYTRNGAFHINNKGNIVDDNGRYLLAFEAIKPEGATPAVSTFNAGVKLPLKIDTDQGVPTQTRNIAMKLNLNGAAPKVEIPLAFTSPNAPFIPDPKTYNHTTSITTYDSIGNAHIVSSYFAKTPTQNEWRVYTFIDGRGVNPGTPEDSTQTPIQRATGATILDAGIVPDGVSMTFDSAGIMLTGANGSASPITTDGTTPINPNIPISTKVDFGFSSDEFNKLLDTTDNTGAIIPSIYKVADQTISIDLGGSTQFSSPFTVNDLKQDGMAVGNLTGVDVDTKGIVYAKYSNGFAKPLGQVALARFPNNQDLAKVGGTTWLSTADSGNPIYGAGGDNNFGVVRSSSLENSNVDLSEQLVKLIVAQQAYQANSQTVSTEKSLLDTILRI